MRSHLVKCLLRAQNCSCDVLQKGSGESAPDLVLSDHRRRPTRHAPLAFHNLEGGMWSQSKERQWEHVRRISDYLLGRPVRSIAVTLGVLLILAATVWLGFYESDVAAAWLVTAGLVLMTISTAMGLAYPKVTGKPADEVLAVSWAFAVAVGWGGWVTAIGWGAPRWMSGVALALSAIGLVGSTAIAQRERGRRAP